MSTFVLLTITGLGLGAMYFLVASGLSLIYGLMGVLNFAHGAFITVGAYSAWWFGEQIGGGAGTRLLVGGAFGLVVGAPSPALVELVLIRPLYRRPIEQVLVTVGLALALGALVQGIWGPTRSRSPCRVDDRHDDGLRRERPERPLRRDRVAAVVLLGLTAFLRYTRYGLVIRAGVENRAMVTALGIDVRRAFTLVFALGGALAALAGVLSGVYFGVVDPGRGTSLLIFAFIVVVIGGFGSIGGSAVAAVAVGLLQQYANYYASTRHRRPRRRAAPRDRAPRPPGGLAPEGGALRRALGIVVPVAAARAARARAEAVRSTSRSCSPARSTARHAAAPRALPPLRRRRADVRRAVRLHGSALVRPRALLRGRRLRDRDRADELGVGALADARVRPARRAAPAARARRRQPARRRHRVRDGHARVRTGRAACSCRRTRTAGPGARRASASTTTSCPTRSSAS